MNQHRRKTDYSSYSFTTTTGRGPAKVQVGYEMDSDGGVYDVVVHLLDGCDITASLDDDSYDILTDECCAHYEKEAEQSNTDLKIAAAESKTPYYYNDRV